MRRQRVTKSYLHGINVESDEGARSENFATAKNIGIGKERSENESDETGCRLKEQ